MTRPVSMWGPNAQGVRSRPDRSVVLNPGDVERMGFDFDEFDRLISEGTSEAEQNPWDLVVDPETGELVERSALGRSSGLRGALEASLGAWVDIRDAVGSYVANVEGFDWEDMATVEEMADQISHDILGEADLRGGNVGSGLPLEPTELRHLRHIYDRVWTEIIQAGEHAGYEYDLGEFVRFGPGGSSVSEFQATPALTGLGGFQSPRMPSGLPGFQSPGSMPSGLPGFQSPGMLSDLPGFQSPGVPSGPPGFGVPSDGLLQDLVSRMGDMPLEHKLALAAALAGAGLLTVGTGGLAGPALMAGGGLSLLGNQ